MTRKEAIEILKRNKPTSDTRRCGTELCEAVDMAIESLENQIPIRPIMRIEERGFNKGCIYPHCPICDTMPVPHPNVSYCDKCGQAIDWSESK